MSWLRRTGPESRGTLPPRSPWLGRGWLIFVLAVAALAAILAVLILRQYERIALSARFAQHVSDHHALLLDRLNEPIERLHAVGALFEASDVVTAAEFQRFTAQLQQQAPHRFVFVWAPRVAGTERASFEAARQRDGDAGFSVREPDATGRPVPVAPRDEYFPLVFISDEDAAAHLGLDTTFEPVRRAAVAEARDKGEVIATAPVPLLPRPSHAAVGGARAGCALVFPIYAGDPPEDVATRRARFAGFVATAIAFDDTLGATVAGLGEGGVRLVVTDDTASALTVLAREANGGESSWWSYVPLWTPAVREDVRGFDLAGRRWTARYAPTDRFYALHGTGRPELGLAASGALFLLLAAYLVARDRGIQRLAAAEEAVRMSETHFRSLIEAGSAVILALDSEGRVMEWNPAAEQTFGVSRDEAVGTDYVTRFVPPADREAVAAEIRRVQGGGTSQGYENLVTTVSGEARTFAWNAAPLFYQPGRSGGLIAIGSDVTEQKRIEGERKRLERKFLESQRLESLEVLAGGVAHDFNNLLFVVLGNADLALSDLEPSAPAREAVVEIKAAAERASHLAGLMLAYSGRGHFRLEPLDLNGPVSEALESLPMHLADGIALEQALSPTPLVIRGDARQLRQLATTLVVNAAEAVVPPGSITVTTRLVVTTDRTVVEGDDEGLPPGAYVALAVADTGTGMPDDVLARIFDPFYSTKFVGRGLGLPAARGILRGHRAHIAVRSAPGQGSVFTVYFTPAPQGAEVEPAAAPRG